MQGGANGHSAVERVETHPTLPRGAPGPNVGPRTGEGERDTFERYIVIQYPRINQVPKGLKNPAIRIHTP